MRGIGTKRTGVERRVRKVMRSEKIRFKGNVRSLPGSPDLVIPNLKLAIFVNGCFWHGCPRCYTAPKHNRAWWNRKISNNRRRDRRVTRQLRDKGFSVVHLWEHDSDERIRTRVRYAYKRQKKDAARS
jgi:DNA mismatch endonuclease (patch repair protein)